MVYLIGYKESDASDSSGIENGRAPHSTLSSSSSTRVQDGLLNSADACTSGSSSSHLQAYFVDMGFSKELVAKAIKENGEGDSNAVLASLLAYSALEESPDCEDSYGLSSASDRDVLDDEFSDAECRDVNEERMDDLPEMEKNRLYLLEMGFPEDQVSSAIDISGPHASILELANFIYAAQTSDDAGDGHQERIPRRSINNRDECGLGNLDHDSSKGMKKMKGAFDGLSEIEQQKLQLMEMGYPEDQIAAAMNRCGPNAPIDELVDSILAAESTETPLDSHCTELPNWKLDQEDESGPSNLYSDLHRPQKKKKVEEYTSASAMQNKKFLSQKDTKYSQKSSGHNWEKDILVDDDDETSKIFFPQLHNMVGFGVPNQPPVKIHRKIPEAVMGPPYFYYENVALAPKGVWETMSRFLYDIEPEFVDSTFFSATHRKRGYIHNLPIENRFQVQPIPPLTIQDTLPYTKKYWPSWDPRTKFNCIQTCTGSAKLTERILKVLDNPNGLSLNGQKYVLQECRKWNLVWVGPSKVAPLEPDEIELLLGFSKNHTRGGGVSRTERFKVLGNSFQVDTVAYHLSVLKKMYPDGINVLSLFTGIGGAEVALYRLGIPLRNVVSVEVSEVNQNILRNWWDQTGQTGKLIDIGDVQILTADKIKQLIGALGGFHLVIGGSPCNNLTGSNRVSRHGLEGKDSSLFFDFYRILDLVRCLMVKN